MRKANHTGLRIRAVVLLSLAIAYFPGSLYAQATDNTGKDLFVVKNIGGLSVPITSTGFSLNYTTPLTKEDTVPISASRYKKLKTAFDASVKEGDTSRKEPVMVATPKDTSYYEIIHHNAPRLYSYYSPASVRAILHQFQTKLPKGFGRKVFYQLDTSGYTETPLLDSLVKLLADSNKPIPSLYSVTDIGDGFRPLFVNLKVSNLSIKSFGQFFSNANQPSVQLELGFIQNSVLKFNDWDKLQDTKGFLRFYEYDLFYSIYVNTNCIDYIDTVNQRRTPYDLNSLWKFNQYGAKIDFNVYKSKNVALAFTANGWYGLPLDNDKSFQNGASKPIIAADTSFKVLGQSAGKYGGAIDNKLWNARLSVAMPIFFDLSRAVESIFKYQQQAGSKFYLMPSYAPFISSGTKWTNQVGISLNLLSQPYGPPGTTIVQAGGFGFDLLSNPKAKTGWGSPIFYVSGTINLGSIITKAGSSKVRGQ